MTAPQLAKSTYISGPDDKLAVIDVYEQSGSGVVNSYQETHGEAIDVLEGLNGEGGGGGGEGGGGEGSGGSGGSGDGGGGDGGSDVYDDVWDMAGDNSDLLAPNNEVDDLLDAVNESNDLNGLANMDSDILSDLANMGEGIKDSMCAAADFADDVFSTVGDVATQLVKGVALPSAAAVSNVIGRLAGGAGPAISSVGGMSRLVANTAMTASRIGIPNAFGTIASGALASGKMDKSILTRAVSMMVPDIIKRANIPLLNDIARSPVGNIISRVDPGIIGSTIRNMARPTYLNQGDYGRYYGNARDTFDIVDPYWNRTQFGNREVLNANVISQNAFMQEAMMSNVRTRPLYITPEPYGNQRYTNQHDVYYNPSPYHDRDYNSGGYKYNADGSVIDIDDRDLYMRRTSNRKNDAFLAAAVSFGQTTVEAFLRKEFTNVNAKINRSINAL